LGDFWEYILSKPRRRGTTLHRLANEVCLKMYHVNLETQKTALNARGTPFTVEGLMVLAVMSRVIDLEKGKER
jgi:hypothetical protein